MPIALPTNVDLSLDQNVLSKSNMELNTMAVDTTWKRSSSTSAIHNSGRTSPAASHDSSLYTSDTIDVLRRRAKSTNDSMDLFQFALHLLSLSKTLATEEEEMAASRPMFVLDSPRSIRSLKEKDLKKKSSSPSEKLLHEAMKYLKKLAYSGVGLGKIPLPEAQYFMAQVFFEGKFNHEIDYERAFYLYIQGSKSNHPESVFKAADCYEHGLGTKKNLTKAVHFYRKAASLGDPFAMHRFGLILQRGQLGQLKNPREAITWLKRSADIAERSNYPSPIHDLAQCYEKKGGSAAVIPDESYAFYLYEKAAQLGYAPSQYRLGLCYEYGHLNCKRNSEQSIYWYSKAAQQDHPKSQLALSAWYLTGSAGFFEANEKEAFLWALKAAEHGLPQAQRALGEYYETGKGTLVDLKEAVGWYTKASLQNNQRAKDRLKEIKKLIRKGKLPRPDGFSIESRCTIM